MFSLKRFQDNPTHSDQLGLSKEQDERCLLLIRGAIRSFGRRLAKAMFSAALSDALSAPARDAVSWRLGNIFPETCATPLYDRPRRIGADNASELFPILQRDVCQTNGGGYADRLDPTCDMHASTICAFSFDRR